MMMTLADLPTTTVILKWTLAPPGNKKEQHAY